MWFITFLSRLLFPFGTSLMKLITFKTLYVWKIIEIRTKALKHFPRIVWMDVYIVYYNVLFIYKYWSIYFYILYWGYLIFDVQKIIVAFFFVFDVLAFSGYFRACSHCCSTQQPSPSPSLLAQHLFTLYTSTLFLYLSVCRHTREKNRKVSKSWQEIERMSERKFILTCKCHVNTQKPYMQLTHMQTHTHTQILLCDSVTFWSSSTLPLPSTPPPNT